MQIIEVSLDHVQKSEEKKHLSIYRYRHVLGVYTFCRWGVLGYQQVQGSTFWGISLP